MRDILRFGKRRDRNEWDPESELIKAGAFIREWPCGIGCKCGAKRLLNVQAQRALRASPGLLAGWRIRKIGAQPGHDAVRGSRVSLWRPRRSHVIVRASMFIVSDEDDRIFPEW